MRILLNGKIWLFCSLFLLVSGCSETQFAAHVAKQIPLPGELTKSKSIGYFKVGKPYKIKGRRYTPKERYSFTQTGMASWYGPNFHGKMTANGEIFDKHELTAAHRTLQMPSIIRVTNLGNGRSIIVRVNDRGPFAHDRVLDLSERAATVLGFKNAGTAKVKIDVLGEPSRNVAAAAKAGRDTRGYEVALNNQKPNFAYEKNKAEPQNQAVQTVALNTYGMRNPQPVTAEQLHLPPGTKKIYVQAGSFSSERNALEYSKRLSAIGPSKVYLTRINTTPYFRVRLGPYNSEREAAEAITKLYQQGNQNAVLVKE